MKTSLVQISNLNKSIAPVVVRKCDHFLQKFKGLMFIASISENGGILIDEQSESIVNTSIHMLFMNFDITAVWINADREIVDVKLAKKWALAYFPAKSARYVLEISSSRINDFNIGDKLSFTNVA